MNTAIERSLSVEITAAGVMDALRRHAPDAPAAELEALAAVLEPFLENLPSTIEALTAMTKEPRVGRAAAFVAGQALLYLVDPDDLLPEDDFGPLGLVDDAYLIHACIASLRATHPGVATASASYVPPDGRTLTTVRSILPAGVTEALDRTCENLVRVASALFAPGRENGAVPDAPKAALRVANALQTLG